MDFESIEKKINYRFNNRGLLEKSLTHSAYAYEKYGSTLEGNERLEFIGDAVLDASIGKMLYESFPGEREGNLTKLRALIVCESSLAQVFKKKELNFHLLLNAGSEQCGARSSDSVCADAMEAVFGAVFIDGGYDAADAVIKNILSDIILLAEEGKLFRDSKTELQEYVQAKGMGDLEYHLLGETGPDHDKSFFVSVSCSGKELAKGSGKSKKNAQFDAAAKALEIIRAGC